MATRIPTSHTGASIPAAPAPAAQPARPVANEREAYLPPLRPPSNVIPNAEQILTLVARGRAALSRGIFWDRGSIINVLL